MIKSLAVLLLLAVAAPMPGLAMAAPDGPHRDYVDGPFGQIHVRIDGRADQPTAILLHRMVWSSVQFEAVQPLMAVNGVRTIAVDLPGYGLSDSPSREPTAGEYADALLPVLAHFNLQRVDLVGSDTGSVIAIAFANRHPDRVRRLVLDGVPLFDAATTAQLLDEEAFDRRPTADGSEFQRRYDMVGTMAPGDRMSPKARQAGVMQFFSAGPNYLWGHHAIFKYGLEDGLKRLKAPTMVLGYPGLGSDGSYSTVRALRPDFAYVRLDFKGMMASYDDPQSWANAVADYLLRP